MIIGNIKIEKCTYGVNENYFYVKYTDLEDPSYEHREFYDGTKHWYKNGKFHRDDGPAVIAPEGTKKWYQNGRLHRDDGPAVIHYNGTKEWYQNGRLHRDDGPAVINADGTNYWFKNGKQYQGLKVVEV